MAHFAELDETNTVLRVLVVHNDITYLNDVEYEQRGIDFLNDLFPDSGEWKQCSYSGSFRGRFVGAGSTYDSDSDIFLSPKPFPSWVLDEETEWQPPTPYPDDGYHDWDEDTTSWVEVE